MKRMKSQSKAQKIAGQLLLTFFGTLLLALAYNLFFVPCDLAPGGFTGFATVLHELLGAPIGLTSALMNLPLFVINFRYSGKRAFVLSVCATVLLSVLLDTLPVAALTEDLLLASLLGGALFGAGIGLVFYGGASTGGTDLAAQLLCRLVKGIGFGTVLFVLDFLVVLFAGIVFDLERALYAVIGLFVSSRIVDTMQEGLSSARTAFIISDHQQEIAQAILSRLDRGVTRLDGVGVYSGKERRVLLCVVGRREIITLKALVGQIDPQAFVIVGDAREIMGKGFSLPD